MLECLRHSQRATDYFRLLWLAFSVTSYHQTKKTSARAKPADVNGVRFTRSLCLYVTQNLHFVGVLNPKLFRIWCDARHWQTWLSNLATSEAPVLMTDKP
jgi:hypothetical protein